MNNNSAELKQQIDSGVELLTFAEQNRHRLTSENNNLASQVMVSIGNMPNGAMKTYINAKLDQYEVENRKDPDKTRPLALVRVNSNVPQLIEEKRTTKMGFINIFILIYGMINVGIIFAIAFMK